ncbi:hypothetical protein F4802DRAFT_172982 [Xylaria palmicola]|nr:hypothetical protein F4802DRAFT_172982 [Xylaria palmicola]
MGLNWYIHPCPPLQARPSLHLHLPIHHIASHGIPSGLGTAHCSDQNRNPETISAHGTYPLFDHYSPLSILLWPSSLSHHHLLSSALSSTRRFYSSISTLPLLSSSPSPHQTSPSLMYGIKAEQHLNKHRRRHIEIETRTGTYVTTAGNWKERRVGSNNSETANRTNVAGESVGAAQPLDSSNKYSSNPSETSTTTPRYLVGTRGSLTARSFHPPGAVLQ